MVSPYKLRLELLVPPTGHVCPQHLNRNLSYIVYTKYIFVEFFCEMKKYARVLCPGVI